MSNELLQKVIDTTEVGAGGGGLLKPEQSNRFIDYMFDATILTRVARTIRMRSDTTEIDKVGVGEKLMVLATEGASTGQTDRGATFTKVSLTTKKLRLDWELSSESLEDNIEGADLEDHIARLMATQAGNDIEDLAINGDTALTSDNLYKAFNGFRKLALNGGQVVDAGGATISKATFNSALKAMPRKYKQRRNQLRFFTGSNLVQDYLYNLTTVGSTPEDIASSILRGNPAAPEGNPGGVIPFAFGIPVVEVPLIDETRTGTYSGATGQHGEVHLTFPQNFIVGIKRDITVYREFKPKKDTIEYTLYIRVGVAVENLDSFVVVKNVKVAS
jgi:HK97 family phage major capsid protein